MTLEPRIKALLYWVIELKDRELLVEEKVGGGGVVVLTVRCVPLRGRAGDMDLKNK